MKHDVSYNLFAAKDVAKILGINSNMLFHWVQTKGLIKPAVRGLGRGTKNYFSLEDLATLWIIKVLYKFGIDLWRIKDIVDHIVVPNPILVSEVGMNANGSVVLYNKEGAAVSNQGDEPINIWQIYKKGKTLFDKNGLILRVYRGSGSITMPAISFNKEMKLFNEEEKSPWQLLCLIAINVLVAIREIEKKTGLEL